MAQPSFSALVSETRNRLGTNVFARNRYGPFIRDIGPTNDPATDHQLDQRYNFSAIVDYWIYSVTEEQRQAWNKAAFTVTKKNIFGDRRRYSGFNLFVKCALVNRLCSWGMSFDPPTNFFPAAPIENFNLDGSFPGQLFVEMFPNPVPSNENYLIYATDNLSPAKYFVRNEFRFMYALPPEDSTNVIDIKPQFEAYFGHSFNSGNKIFVKVLRVTNNGIHSPRKDRSIIYP